jgi:hypothetical protein
MTAIVASPVDAQSRYPILDTFPNTNLLDFASWFLTTAQGRYLVRGKKKKKEKIKKKEESSAASCLIYDRKLLH